MPRRYSAAELAALLERLGLVRTRQRRSHIRYRGTFRGARRRVMLVARQRQIPARTLRSIAGQLGLTADELKALLGA
jgi:predicted RNA binding protein YcfA (HicA-like mRNA interferase family)